MQEIGLGKAMAFALKDGYAYKPGLHALIKLGESAMEGLVAKGNNTASLKNAIRTAKAVYAKPVEEKAYAGAINTLRSELAAFRGIVPEADVDCLHYYSVK